MEHEPVEIRASPQALLTLTKDITGFRVEELMGGRGEIISVWFQTDQIYVVSVDILGLEFKFEVFTLVVKAADEMLSMMQHNATLMQHNATRIKEAWTERRNADGPVPPMGSSLKPAPAGELTQWPFRSWRLDVLKRMSYIVSSEHLPETASATDSYLASLAPGEAPAGSEHTCLTAMGLLFTSEESERFLIVADGMPGFMKVTQDEEVVQSYLRQCIVVPATEYAFSLS